MNKELMKRYVRFAAIPAAITAAIGLLVATDSFNAQEMFAYDRLMSLSAPVPQSKDIVIVEIADDTLKALTRWPLPREYYSVLVQALSESGARLIVFDILFSEPSDADEELAQSFRDSGRVLIPCAFNIKKRVEAYTDMPESEEILGGVAPALKNAVAGIGHINVVIDPDGKIRRIPLFIRHGATVYPSLGFLTAKAAGWKAAREPVKAAGKGSAFWIRYPGPWTETFTHVSFIDVIKAYSALHSGSQPWMDLSVFKDKICFVGLTATGTSDLRPTPIDPVYPMVGSQASIANSFFQGMFIRRLDPWARFAVGAGITAAAVVLALALSPLMALSACLFLGWVYLWAAWYLFGSHGLFIDVAMPVVLILASYIGVFAFRFFKEIERRKILEKELEIGATIQQSFLPAQMRNFKNIELRTSLKAARFVAGDLYDTLCLDDQRLGVFIGDVSGKGVSAALIMAQAISLFRIFAHRYADPAQVLAAMNAQLADRLQGRFVTAQYLVFDTQRNTYEGACAGHMSALKIQDGAVEETVAASGPPLGLMREAVYASVKGDIRNRTKFFLYTDGWTESRDRSGAEFGIGRLKEAVMKHAQSEPDDFMGRMQGAHEAFELKENLHDDVTAILVDCKPAQM